MKKNYTVSDFVIERDGFHIGGQAYRSKKREKGLVPVILSHGFMNGARETRPMAIALAKAGYAAFIYEFVGGSFGKMSDGEITDMTISTEIADLRAVMDYVKGLDYTDETELVLAGCSQGGFVSGLTAARFPGEIKKLILYYPALCIPDDCRAGSNMGLTYDPENIPDLIEGSGPFKLSGNFPREMMDVNAIEEVSSFPGEILLIAGQHDPIVNYDYMVKLVAAVLMKREKMRLSEAGISFFPLQDGGHGFNRFEYEWAKKRTVSWLRGLDEVLTIHVDIQGVETEHIGKKTITTIPFGAECANEFFNGTALPGSKDVQQRKYGKIQELKADYVMEGSDYREEECRIHIINRDTGNGWVPFVETDSEALSFLNRQQCVTIAEGGPSGLIIHILANPNL